MNLEISKPGQMKWLRNIVVGIIVLNLLDGLLTLIWVLTEKAEEANPLMAGLLDINPVLFIIFKMGLVMGGTYLLWRLRRKAAAVMAIFLAFLVYYGIILFHLRSMNLQLVQRWFE